MNEETRPLQQPTSPCPHCRSKEFILWRKTADHLAITCDNCGAVLSSTHPLDPDDRPIQISPSPPDYDPRKHNFYKKLMNLLEGIRLPPGVMINNIYHDSWCQIYQGGYCNCDPEIELPAMLAPERN